VVALIAVGTRGPETVFVALSRVPALIVAAVSLALIVGATVLDQFGAHAGVSSSSPLLYPLLCSAVAAPALVGLLLEFRLPRHPIAWILLLGGLSVAIVLFAAAYAKAAVLADLGLPAAGWAGIVSDASWPVFFGWPLALAFVFPNGRLLSPKWRPFPIAALVSGLLLIAMIALTETHLEAPLETVENPLPTPLAGHEALRLPVVLALFVTLLASLASVRERRRRSFGIERLQLRWLLWSVLLIPFGFAFCFLWGVAVGPAEDGVLAVLLLAETAAAVAVGIAVTRYRLYAVDRLINRTLVYGVLSFVLGAGYVGMALGLGVAAGRGSVWPTAIATLTVAVAFRPLRARVQRAVDWRFDRARFEGLRRIRAFEADVRSGGAAPEQVGEVLAQAVRDPSATLLFWLPASAIYADATGTPAVVPEDGRARTEARRNDAQLGILLHNATLLERRDLLDGVLAAAGLAIEIARLRVEVKLQLAEVEASRARIVEAGYEERRRLERDLHDGSQQRLVSLGIHLRRMQRSLPREARVLRPALDQAVDEIGRAIVDLRHIAAGVHPARLDEGLAAALRDLARSAPVTVHVDATSERLPPSVEIAAYFVACEAVTNAVKHASASCITISALTVEGDRLVLSIEDDGIGGAKPRRGSGLAGLSDRVDAHGGRLNIASAAGKGTRVEAELPCAP
jgi:signal transduction histidine kinase